MPRGPAGGLPVLGEGPGREAPRVLGADDDDAALQEAIRASLEDAEERRRLEEREAVEVAEAVDIVEAAEIAEAIHAVWAADDADEASLAAAEEEQNKVPRPQAACREPSSPSRPPPGLVQTFAPKQWLNDQSIALAYGHLVASALAGNCAAGGGLESSAGDSLPEGVLLMDPATAFMLAVLDDLKTIEEAKRSLKLQERELVICPVNDSSDGGLADGGTHWALLVWWGRLGHGSGGGPPARVLLIII